MTTTKELRGRRSGSIVTFHDVREEHAYDAEQESPHDHA